MWSSNLINSGPSEGGFLDNSYKDEQDDVKSRRIQTVLPALIEDLLTASSIDKIKVWNYPARLFAVVAAIRGSEETPTKLSYNIEDHTGTMVAMKWLEADRKVPETIIEDNTYVRITGFLREYDQKRTILILRIWPIKSLNEITSHWLENTYILSKLKSIQVEGETESRTESSNIVANEAVDENSPYYGMTPDQALVYKIIQTENETESGIERSRIKVQVPKRILHEVDNILDFLASEGHIYTTSTDDHFKTT